MFIKQVLLGFNLALFLFIQPVFSESVFKKYFTFDKQKPSIVVITTGGAISGALLDKTSSKLTVGNISGEALLLSIHEGIQAFDIVHKPFTQKGSQDLSFKNMKGLVKLVNQLVKDSRVYGVVVTHGTDTISQTAFLSHLLVKTSKPIVFVGAVRPYNHYSPDGPSNLVDAISIAANKDAVGKGVLVTMNGSIFSARDVDKVGTRGLDSIESFDFGKMGLMTDSGPNFYYSPLRPHTMNSVFNLIDFNLKKSVIIIHAQKSNNGLNYLPTLDSMIKGIVVAGMGNGNIPSQLLNYLKDAQKKGVVVVRARSSDKGYVARDIEIDDSLLGFITADTLSVEKAQILLNLAMSKTKNLKEIQLFFDKY